MSIGTTIYGGGEDTSFTLTGSVSVLGAGFRSGWARESLSIPGSTSDPPTDLAMTPTFPAGAVSFIWGHGRFEWPGLGGGTTLNATMYRLLDSGVARIVVRGAGSGAIKVDKRDAAGTFTNLFTSANGAVPSSGSTSYGFDLRVDYSVTGSVTLWINSALVGSFTGDVTTDSATTLDQAEYSSPYTSQPIFWSEEFGSDTITINAGLFTFEPLAAGTTQTWAGVAANIDKVTIDDSSFISDNSAGDLSGWTTPVSLPTGAWLIQSVIQEARAAVGLSGPQHFDWYARTADGSDHLGGASNAPTTFFANFNNFIWAQNPHTSADWVPGDFTTGFNLGVKSLA